MTKCWMKKGVGQKLEPSDEIALAYIKKLKPGADVEVDIRRPRNIKFHRKWMALAKVVFDNQEKYQDFEEFRKELTMLSGWWKEHHHASGKISYVAKSISFTNMEQEDFDKMFDKSIDVAIKIFIPGTDKGELINAVLEFA